MELILLVRARLCASGASHCLVLLGMPMDSKAVTRL